jgi:hypothetical protein
MAVDPCATRGPLTHAGSTQSGRQKPALDTAYFRPDERDIADLILFGQRFSKYLQYYNSANSKSGDWSAFFTGDVAAALATLSKLPIEDFRQQQSDLEHWLSKEPTRPATELAAHAKLGFHVPILLLEQAALSHEKLPIHHPFRAPLTQLFQREFEGPLTDISSWYKGALDVSGPGTEVFNNTAPQPADFNLDGAPADTRLRLGDRLTSALNAGLPKFSDHILPTPALAKFTHPNWADLYTNSPADPSPYVDAAGASNRHYEQTYDLLNYNLYQAALERIYSGLIRIRTDAVTHLQTALTDFADHTPHYGLWLAFLQVYEHAKTDLNQFSDRHMRFYFRDILRIATKTRNLTIQPRIKAFGRE